MSVPEPFNNRILVIDDNISIHNDFRKILCRTNASSSALFDAEQLVFDAPSPLLDEPTYEVDSAYQGLEGIAMIQQASEENRPYALAFVDVRIPPGLDGIQTIEAFWKDHPDVQVMLCTAYSDYSWENMQKRLGLSDKLLILKKPFDTIEVRQIACAMTAKWNLNRKREQNEKAQQRLTEELKASNLELAAARNAADAANVAKSAFLANMSHEIRTPMNAIIGFNYLMNQTAMTVRQRDYTAKSGMAAESLLALINGILDLSKVESGKIDLEHIAFNLDDVFSKILQVTTLLAQQKGLKFNVNVAPDVPRLLIGDPTRLEQVLLNLSSNAIKFTEKGGVAIGVELTESAGTDVALRFRVRDTGVGLLPSEIGKLFQPFSQADSSTTRKHGGTGLGLAISKQLVKLMRGTMAVESAPGQGSIFGFTAHFAVQANPVERKGSEYVPRGKRNALVIDCNIDSRSMITAILGELHFNVTEFSTCKDAWAEIPRNGNAPSPFDLLVIDASDSGSDWLTDILRIRERFDGGVSPEIILIADDKMADLHVECSGLGVHDIVFKPVTRSAIFDAIARSQASEVQPVQSEKADSVRGNLLKGTRILVVEDQEINRQLLEEVLEMAGCEVIAVSTGPEAITMITNSFADDEFDAVLMDLHMPGMDGLTATRKIRAIHRFAHLPIIAMTGDAIEGVQASCMDAGMTDYLTKPFKPDRVFATLRRWIKAKSIPPSLR